MFKAVSAARLLAVKRLAENPGMAVAAANMLKVAPAAVICAGRRGREAKVGKHERVI
jgi:hypothetical protein